MSSMVSKVHSIDRPKAVSCGYTASLGQIIRISDE